MRYYIRYRPRGNLQCLPECFKKEEDFEIGIGASIRTSIAKTRSIENRKDILNTPISILQHIPSEADEIEEAVKTWHKEHHTEITPYDTEFIDILRKNEEEARGQLDTRTIEKIYNVEKVRNEMKESTHREYLDAIDSTMGGWVEVEPGKMVWLYNNYPKKTSYKIEHKNIQDKRNNSNITRILPVKIPIPIIRVEVTLGGKEILVELTPSSNIEKILHDLQLAHVFSEKMKKKLEALLTQNKPT